MFSSGRAAKLRSTFVWLALLFVVLAILDVQVARAGELLFDVAGRYKTGLQVADSAVADLDGDGNLDLAVVNSGRIGPTATATLLFGNGDGGFASQLVVLPTDAVGNTIAVGDLNNDGRPDVVVATYIENVLIVFLNLGNRQFSPPVFTQDLSEANGEYFDLAIADFDGDGTNDVVGLQDQSGQRLRFFRADAQGRLTVFALFSFPVSPDQSYGSKIAVGDVNGDHRPDVVWFDDNPNSVWAIWFVYGQSPGTPLSRTYGWDIPYSVLAARIADVDSDNDNDIVMITGTSNGGLRVLRNDNNNFTALPRIPIESPLLPDDITIADFNSDGKQDLGVLYGSGFHRGVMVGIKYGVGDCTFTEGKYYATSKSTHIFSGDLNRDNKADILTASTFGLENVPGSFFGGINNSTANVLLNENPRGFKAPLVKLWGPNFIDYGDFDEDGHLDMLSSWSTSANNGSGADVSINDRLGGFFEEVHYPSPPTALRDMKAGDFNGDGHVDAITAHWWDNTRSLAVYFGNGSGTIATPVVSSIAQAVSKIVVADFNRDGKDDVLVVEGFNGHCMLGVGDGTFVLAPNGPILFGNSEFVHASDVNGDKVIDLVNTGETGATKLWIGNGTGQFSLSTASIPGLRLAVTGDFNGDGHIDLVGTTAPVGTVPAWRTDIAITGILGNGTGGFSGTFSKNIPDYSNNRKASSIVVGDFDLDGFDDVAIAHPRNTFGNLVIVRSGGSTPSWQEPIFAAADTATRTLKVADFDGNGRPDIEWLGDNSRGVIYNGWQREANRAPYDFDGDGKTDVGIFRPVNGQWWYRRSSDAEVHAVQFGAGTDVVTPGDFTGDGKADVAFFRPATGFWFVLRSEDNSFFSFPFGTNGDIPQPADYDGDGKTDPTVFRPGDQNWYIQRSTGEVYIQQFGAAGDKPVAADYDGDGKSDIAIWRASLGQWWVQRSSNLSVFAVQFGANTDRPTQGDFTGDGKADVAFWRPATGFWFVLRSEDNSFFSFPFGATGDIPTPGDYDGDGNFDAAVFRPSNATWYIQRSTAGVIIQQFGLNDDKPIPNAFVP